MSSFDQATSRRRFLQFLAASPLFAYGGFTAFAGEGPTAGTKLSDPIMWAPLRTEDLIKSPKEAINVFDFEPVMRHNVPPAHFGYMASGVDDEVTLRANREGFLKFQLRPRRLVDVSKVDMSTEILGVKYDTPIIVAPVGGQKAFYTGGEIDVAKAAKVGNHLQILSTVTTSSVEDVTAARGAPIWYQLYATNKWEVAKAFVTRAEKAGCLAVAVTVDRNGGRNQETLARLQRTDTRECSACHDRSSLQANLMRRPMYDGSAGFPNPSISSDSHLRPDWIPSRDNSSNLDVGTKEGSSYHSLRRRSAMSSFDQATSRRRFLQFLAASPLFAYGSFSAFAGEGPTASRNFPTPSLGAAQDGRPHQESQGGDQRVRFRAGDAPQRSARAFRLHGLGRRR